MMQSSLPGFACVIEPSNNSGVAASQNASTSTSAGGSANFFRFQIIGARLACLVLVMAWACCCLACGDSHHQNKLKS
jgi:hypothetical protein